MVDSDIYKFLMYHDITPQLYESVMNEIDEELKYLIELDEFIQKECVEKEYLSIESRSKFNLSYIN